MFWQLTIDANDPALLARFWTQALDYQSVPTPEPETTWHAHYRARLGEEAAFDDRLFDPGGMRPPIWSKRCRRRRRRRTGSTSTCTPAALVELGAGVEHRTRHDDPEDPTDYVVMHDLEGNEFCVS